MRLISRISFSISKSLYFISEKLYRLIAIFDALNVAVLTPEEMVDIGRRAYNRLSEQFGSEEAIRTGLVDWENEVVTRFCQKKSSFLVLGCGGGREVIALAKMGFFVVGIDSSSMMLEIGRVNAQREKVTVDFREGDFLSPDTGKDKFSYCLLSCVMYSSVPSRQMRVAMLRQIRNVLEDKGILIIHFLLDSKKVNSRWHAAKKKIASLFRGNVTYSPGDTFSTSLHFMRYFPSDKEIVLEAKEAGFLVQAKGVFPESEYMVLSLEGSSLIGS